MKHPRLVVGVACVGIGGALALGFFANPAAVPGVAPIPSELLQDASFEQPATLGTWNVTPAGDATPADVFRNVDSSNAPDLRRIGQLTNGTISQEVLLTPVRGRAYRFSVRVRSTAADQRPAGSIVAQTACANGEEVAETPFVASSGWVQVSATVQPVDGERCTMRVKVTVPNGSIAVDDASFADAGLVNPSFELGAGRESWTIDRGASVDLQSSGAVDGKQFLRVVTSSHGAGIRQDARVDASTQPVLATASVLVRAVNDPSVRVRLEYREPCSDVVHRAEIAASSSWQRLTVRQPRLRGDTVPPSLIKVDGVPCAGQVAVVGVRAGSFDVDSAALSLQSYWPPEGDPSYQRAVTRRSVVTSPPRD